MSWYELKYHPHIRREILKTDNKYLKISCLPAEIRTRYLQNMSDVTARVAWLSHTNPRDHKTKI